MIKISNNDLYKIYDIMKRLEKIPMPVKKLEKLCNDSFIISIPYDRIEQKRIEIIKKYAQLDKNGEVILDENGKAKIVENYIDECRVELNKLGSEMQEVYIRENFYKRYPMTADDYLTIKKIIKK